MVDERHPLMNGGDVQGLPEEGGGPYSPPRSPRQQYCDCTRCARLRLIKWSTLYLRTKLDEVKYSSETIHRYYRSARGRLEASWRRRGLRLADLLLGKFAIWIWRDTRALGSERRAWHLHEYNHRFGWREANRSEDLRDSLLLDGPHGEFSHSDASGASEDPEYPWAE
jgi:hypothetical protein